MKQRPRRIFYDEKTKRYFYLINKKKKYIKLDKDMPAKKIARINIQNILPVPVKRKTIRPRETIRPIMNESIAPRLVPIAPIAQNLSERYSLYTPKSDLEKKFSKLEERLKAVDTAKGKYATQTNPQKIQSVSEIIREREEGEAEFKSNLNAQQPPGTTSLEPARGIVGNVIDRFTKSNFKEKDFLTYAQRDPDYPKEFPPFNFFKDTILPTLTNYRAPTQAVYNKAKKQFEKGAPTIGLGISDFLKMNGYGEYENDDDGIYNDELEEIFSDKMNKFLPVIASDKMHTLLPLVNKDTKKFGWIQNTEPQKSGGRHWVAYFIDVPNMEVNYYDSLVENDGIPPKESMKGLKKIIEKIRPDYYLKFKYNTIRDQNPSSKNCGYFALKFIMDRYRNVPFKSASAYDKVYDDYGEGEKMIKRFKKYL